MEYRGAGLSKNLSEEPWNYYNQASIGDSIVGRQLFLVNLELKHDDQSLLVGQLARGGRHAHASHALCSSWQVYSPSQAPGARLAAVDVSL